MRCPRIGVTGVQIGQYAQRLFDAGAIPVPVTMRNVDELDGIVFTGGVDIDPQRYGQRRGCKTWIDQERDAVEFPLMHRALQRALPILAICRGMQLLNVVTGGRLFQDIPTEVRSGFVHSGGARHPIFIKPDTHLDWLSPDREIVVNSYHHQGVLVPHGLGAGLIVSAIAPDGVVEVVEGNPDVFKGWIMGVQFHPERVGINDTLSYEVLCDLLFEDFVGKCGEPKKKKRRKVKN